MIHTLCWHRAFVQCSFSTDYTDFSGSMTYFSTALPPPPPSWMQSEFGILCLLCIFHSCLGDGCGDSKRYLTSKGLAMNNTQCVCETSPCSNTQSRARSKCSARKLLQTALLAKIASFTSSSEHLSFVAVMLGTLHIPVSTAAPRGQFRWIKEGLIHSGASLPSLNLLCIPSGIIPSFLPQVLKISCGPQETSDEVHQQLGWKGWL